MLWTDFMYAESTIHVCTLSGSALPLHGVSSQTVACKILGYCRENREHLLSRLSGSFLSACVAVLLFTARCAKYVFSNRTSTRRGGPLRHKFDEFAMIFWLIYSKTVSVGEQKTKRQLSRSWSSYKRSLYQWSFYEVYEWSLYKWNSLVKILILLWVIRVCSLSTGQMIIPSTRMGWLYRRCVRY